MARGSLAVMKAWKPSFATRTRRRSRRTLGSPRGWDYFNIKAAWALREFFWFPSVFSRQCLNVLYVRRSWGETLSFLWCWGFFLYGLIEFWGRRNCVFHIFRGVSNIILLNFYKINPHFILNRSNYFEKLNFSYNTLSGTRRNLRSIMKRAHIKSRPFFLRMRG